MRPKAVDLTGRRTASSAKSADALQSDTGLSWLPTLADDDTPIYSRLLAALEADISSGRLASGTRLPTQRELARTMGISAGTVIRAYAEAERLGILSAQVGRGTFVNGRSNAYEPISRTIDLSLNIPGPRLPVELLPGTLTRLERRGDLTRYLGYSSHAGFREHREALAGLVSSGAYTPTVENLVITNGAQHAMVLAMGVVCNPGDTVLVEAATYHGMRSLAEFDGLKLQGLAMDREGLCPDAFEQACAEGQARVLFTMPTLQNPTGRCMSLERRKRIVEIARRYDVIIVEDDVYAFITKGIEPIAHLAPERTFYISSISKCIIPALRLGILVSPPAFLGKIYKAMRATAWMASPLASLMVSEWIQDGTLQAIITTVRNEAVARTQLAHSILGDLIDHEQQPSFHVWIERSHEEVLQAVSYTAHRGVVTTPLSAPIVDPSLISGLRLSIAAPESREQLARALNVVVEAFQPFREDSPSII
jgi:DNA-binding transcriptional MocR family regulator